MTKNEVFELFLQKSAISVTRLKNGTVCFKDGTGHTLATANILKKFYEISPYLPEQVQVDINDVETWLSSHAPAEKDKAERIPPREFVAKWITEHSSVWKVSPTGKRITFLGHDMCVDRDVSSLTTEMLVDIYTQQLPYRDGEINKTVESYFTHLYSKGLHDMFEVIKYNPKHASAADRWLQKLYDFFKPEEPFEIFSVLFKHWAWQVKRKMKGLEVVHHIWLNFCGAGGIGKTTALKKLCSPLEDVTSTTTIAKVFEDTKEMRRLTENYVLIFDELAINVEGEFTEGKLPPDKNNTLKSMLTGELLDARLYNTQDIAKKRITFSCISSANTHLYDVIYDAETMRRFFEFKCTATPVKDYSDINVVLNNSKYFWQGIDENLERGYFDPSSELGQQITAIQNSYYPTKSSVYEWITDTKAKAGSGGAARAYKAYKQFCLNCGFKSKAMPNFISDIKHALPDSVSGNSVLIDFNLTQLCMKDSGEFEPPVEAQGLPAAPINLNVKMPTVGDFV